MSTMSLLMRQQAKVMTMIIAFGLTLPENAWSSVELIVKGDSVACFSEGRMVEVIPSRSDDIAIATLPREPVIRVTHEFFDLPRPVQKFAIAAACAQFVFSKDPTLGSRRERRDRTLDADCYAVRFLRENRAVNWADIKLVASVLEERGSEGFSRAENLTRCYRHK